MNSPMALLIRDFLKLAALAAVPGVMAGITNGWWIGLKLWLAFSGIVFAALVWAYRKDLLAAWRRK
jgi:hypothetical protein